jgi:hypothetical protein
MVNAAWQLCGFPKVLTTLARCWLAKSLGAAGLQKASATTLLQLLNLVVGRRISTQKRIAQMYSNLPPGRLNRLRSVTLRSRYKIKARQKQKAARRRRRAHAPRNRFAGGALRLILAGLGLLLGLRVLHCLLQRLA